MSDENKKIKILLIDDDRFLLDMYILKFKTKGIDIDTMSSSKDTLTKLRAGENYDIILLDIIMPSIDGIELLKTIKQEKLSPDAVIIMLTNEAEKIKQANDLGVDGYIIKATSIPSEVVDNVMNIYKDKHNK